MFTLFTAAASAAASIYVYRAIWKREAALEAPTYRDILRVIRKGRKLAGQAKTLKSRTQAAASAFKNN